MLSFDVRGFQLRLLLLIALSSACTPISDRGKPRGKPSDGKSGQSVETPESGKRDETDADVATQDDDKTMPPAMVGSAACAGREPGDLYCDDDANMHVCLSATTSRAVPCGELEHCVVVSGRPQCRWATGSVLQDAQCVMGTSYSVDNGCCDPLTKCTPDAAGRKCGACPDGYTGDGLRS